jgi:hypothetical protein
VILDHLDNIQLSDGEVDGHFDALMALARLGEGLHWLFQTVMALERKAQSDAARENIQIAVTGGVLESQPIGLLSCAFQWYAVSACNYAQLVGWLATGDPKSAKDYVRRVAPRLAEYRNKVAAHFALTDPRRDNEADLAASVMTQVVYAHGRLFAAALTPVLDIPAGEVAPSRDLSWSLSLAHERLIPRFWPAGPPKAFHSLRVPPGTTASFNVSWSDLARECT